MSLGPTMSQQWIPKAHLCCCDQHIGLLLAGGSMLQQCHKLCWLQYPIPVLVLNTHGEHMPWQGGPLGPDTPVQICVKSVTLAPSQAICLVR